MKVRKDQCRLWQWKHNPDGYGVVRYKGKQFLAHRVMWQAFNGPIPEGKLILHRCDTPACFNPNHLVIGTYLDNNRDRAAKGRSSRGETHPKAKLTPGKVLKMRELYTTGQAFQPQLSRDFGVSTHTVSMIVNNRIWRHV